MLESFLPLAGFWPFYFPAAVIIAGLTGYAIRRGTSKPAAYGIGALWLALSAGMFVFGPAIATHTPRHNPRQLVIALLMGAPLFLVAELLCIWLMRRKTPWPGAMLVSLLITTLCIPLTGVAALIAICVVTGDCL